MQGENIVGIAHLVHLKNFRLTKRKKKRSGARTAAVTRKPYRHGSCPPCGRDFTECGRAVDAVVRKKGRESMFAEYLKAFVIGGLLLRDRADTDRQNKAHTRAHTCGVRLLGSTARRNRRIRSACRFCGRGRDGPAYRIRLSYIDRSP